MNTVHTSGPMRAGRREFLRRASFIAASAGSPFALNLLALGSASAQTGGGHKALVCVFLAGGNDQSNTVVPMGTAEWNAYAQARPTLAIPRAQLLALNPLEYSEAPLGLHGSLNALKPLFDQQRVALLANVGTLAAPITKAQWNRGNATVPTPAQLFSHSDQQGAWQTGLPDRPSETGWLGRTGDLLASAFNPGSGVSIAMSVAGNNIMQAGNSTIQYQLTTQGAVKVSAVTFGLYGSAAGGTAARRLMSDTRQTLLENELVKVSSRSINTESLVSNALASTPALTAFPDTSIGKQLAMVARMIAARGALAQQRQIFFVQQGGYDFHDNLQNDQAARLKELGDALAAFYQATVSLGVQDNVTTFTASDFGRALQSNGRGSDHGWGGHHFIMGGSVQGNRVYGSFPQTALGADQDAGQGRLIPTTSVDEYAATLATWLGVSNSNLPDVLPNLGRFAAPNLGFMRNLV
jgi:uncharacterized protein (DUF1501 family)